jgi:hypothetical protein
VKTKYLLRVYTHKLQINFEIPSSWIIFGQLTAVGLWNLAKYLVVTTFFRNKVVTTKYLAKFQSPTAVSWSKIIQPERISKSICNLWLYTALIPKIKSISQIIVHSFSLCFEILTWCLVYECIMMSYRSSVHFVPVQWVLVELWSLDWNLTKYLVVTTFCPL